MNKPRKVAAAEKEEICERQFKSELAAHPHSQIVVTVDEETDDDGRPVVNIYRTRSPEMRDDGKRERVPSPEDGVPR